MSNVIIDFIAQGSCLSSNEGINLIKSCEKIVIREALANPEVRRTLLRTANVSSDIELRKKIYCAT